MQDFLEILKYTLPSLIILAVVYIFLEKYITDKRAREANDLKKSSQDYILPVRLQAYERLMLLLERLTPTNLVLRVNNPQFTPYQFQAVLVQTIREEFDHNVAQQLYISDQGWNAVKNAKEEVIRLINTSIVDLDEFSTTGDFAKIIINRWMEMEKDPIREAQVLLKEEVKGMF